jgi:hypothetical protein
VGQSRNQTGEGVDDGLLQSVEHEEDRCGIETEAQAEGETLPVRQAALMLRSAHKIPTTSAHDVQHSAFSRALVTGD